MAKSILQEIYLFLKENNINVFLPVQHIGECKENYVVVKDMGSSKADNISSSNSIYEVMCYVPKESFSSLEIYVLEIKEVMKKLKYKIKISSTNYETPSFYDEDVKAHMISVQYEVYKKL